MRNIYLLTDYKGHFESRWNAKPYRSGFDQSLLRKFFNQFGYECEFIRFSDIRFSEIKYWKGRLVLYTSSEEMGYNYKSFIEDIVLGLEEAGAFLIPNYRYLRANNNKIFMEILRELILGKELSGFTSQGFGTLEELKRAVKTNKIILPCVIKTAAGAMSRGVAFAVTPSDLLKKAKKISRTPHWMHDFKEFVRQYKIPGYRKESRFQGKFIVQPYIPGLKNDWKVLIFNNRYYILRRDNRPNDFRASGSGLFYPDKQANFPMEMLDYLEVIYKRFDVPTLSLDFGYNGKRGYIFEFQAIQFGKSTLHYCKNYCVKEGGKWIWKEMENDFEQEWLYAMSVASYIESHPEMLKQ